MQADIDLRHTARQGQGSEWEGRTQGTGDRSTGSMVVGELWKLHLREQVNIGQWYKKINIKNKKNKELGRDLLS